MFNPLLPLSAKDKIESLKVEKWGLMINRVNQSNGYAWAVKLLNIFEFPSVPQMYVYSLIIS